MFLDVVATSGFWQSCNVQPVQQESYVASKQLSGYLDLQGGISLLLDLQAQTFQPSTGPIGIGPPYYQILAQPFAEAGFSYNWLNWTDNWKTNAPSTGVFFEVNGSTPCCVPFSVLKEVRQKAQADADFLFQGVMSCLRMQGSSKSGSGNADNFPCVNKSSCLQANRSNTISPALSIKFQGTAGSVLAFCNVHAGQAKVAWFGGIFYLYSLTDLVQVLVMEPSAPTSAMPPAGEGSLP